MGGDVNLDLRRLAHHTLKSTPPVWAGTTNTHSTPHQKALKSTPPVWAGTGKLEAAKSIYGDLKSTPPVWAGTMNYVELSGGVRP